MQTFFHILAVVISIFIPLVSIILLEWKTYALRSLDRSLLPPYPPSLHIKKCTEKADALVSTGMVYEKMMPATKPEWENRVRSVVGFCACDLQVIKGAKVYEPPDGGHSEPHFFSCNRRYTRITDLQYKKNTDRVELYNASGDVTLTATELYLWVWNVSSLLRIYDYPFLLISRAMTNILTCEPISLGNVLYIPPGCLLAMRYSANDKQLATCV